MESRPVPSDISHFEEVADVHDDVLQAFAATDDVGVRSLGTKFRPVIVRLTPTVVGKFVTISLLSRVAPDTVGASKVNPCNTDTRSR